MFNSNNIRLNYSLTTITVTVTVTVTVTDTDTVTVTVTTIWSFYSLDIQSFIYSTSYHSWMFLIS